MARQVVSRSQRRMEKRQALVLLLLVLGVSLVSFTLGVMVGRSGSSPESPAQVTQAPKRLPVKRGDAPVAEKTPSQTPEKLTFYDNLPKGESSPIGSGINLPPEKAPEPEKASRESAPGRQETASLDKEVVETVKASPPPEPAKVSGDFAVQVASFQGAEDARKLQERLSGKQYAAFVESADLKEKGTWYRVFVGPYGSVQAANQVAARLQTEEKLDGLVRKR